MIKRSGFPFGDLACTARMSRQETLPAPRCQSASMGWSSKLAGPDFLFPFPSLDIPAQLRQCLDVRDLRLTQPESHVYRGSLVSS